MIIGDELLIKLAEAFNRVDLVNVPEVRRAVDAAFDHVPAPFHYQARAEAAEKDLGKICDAYRRYQRGDLDSEEFEGTVAAIAEELA